MQISPPVNPPSFQAWIRELTHGVSPGDNPHALILVGRAAEGLLSSVYSPDVLKEPYTRRRCVSAYSEGLWGEEQVPRDVHMMVVHVDDVEVLARDSKLIERALATVRAIVFVVPEKNGCEYTVTAIKRLGLGNKLRPCFRIVLPIDMTRIGGVGEDKDREVDVLPSAAAAPAVVTKPGVVKASAFQAPLPLPPPPGGEASQLARLQWGLAVFRAAAARAAAAQRDGI